MVLRPRVLAAVVLAVAAGAPLGRPAAALPSVLSREQVGRGTLAGRVEIKNPARAADRRPGIAELGGGRPYQPAERRRAVVYFEIAPRGAFEETVAGHAVMKQENETFVPHVLAIQAGSVVEFPNGDPFFHNVFSLSKPKRFDLGRYPRGRSKSVRFDEPGVVRVFCEIHSHMSAFILVFAHRFFAVTDDDGRYRIEGVPAGTWTVTVWYEGSARTSGQVTIPESGGTVTADFGVDSREER